MKQYLVTISVAAQNDLKEIHFYIEKVLSAPKTAGKCVRSISKAILSLSIFPQRGRVIQSMSKDTLQFRQLIVGNYRIVYNIVEEMDEVIIVRVLYSARKIRL